MNAMEIRVRIKRLEEQQKICCILVKDKEQYLDMEFVGNLILEQMDIISEARKKIEEIESLKDNATTEIEKLKRQKRFNDKQLIELHNHKQIEELKKLIEKRKELLHGMDNNNS